MHVSLLSGENAFWRRLYDDPVKSKQKNMTQGEHKGKMFWCNEKQKINLTEMLFGVRGRDGRKQEEKSKSHWVTLATKINVIVTLLWIRFLEVCWYYPPAPATEGIILAEFLHCHVKYDI